jgi:hypothetical protein
VLLGLGFALIPLAKGEFFFYWDNAQQFYPLAVYLHDAMRIGEIPQWWFQAGFGVPTLAEGQAAHFHPIRILLSFILSPPNAFMFEIGLYLAVAGLGTYFFLHEFRLQRCACLLGSLCQMFGSFSVVYIKNIPLHRSFCLLPLAMFLAERFVTRRGISYGFAISLVIGLQFLAGHPLFGVMTVLATTIYIACRLLQMSRHKQETLYLTVRQLGSVMTKWVCVVTLGFGIAAIQFIPMLLHVEHSIRQGGLNYQYAVNALPAKIIYLPQLIFPYVYSHGDWLKTKAWWGGYFNVVPSSGIYLGALPVLLAFLGIWWNRRFTNPIWAIAFCFLFAIGLAMGSKTPLFPALWSLPGMNGLRYPSRFLMWASFCLSSLSAYGLHSLIARSRLNLSAKPNYLPFFFLGGVVLSMASFFWIKQQKISTKIILPEDFNTGLIISLVLFAVSFVLVCILLIIRRRHQKILILLSLIFVFADLWMFRMKSDYAITVPINETKALPPVVEFLRKDHDQFRVMTLIPWEKGLNKNADLFEFLQPYTCTIWGIEPSGDYSSLMLKRYYLLHDSILWELLNAPDASEKLAGFLGAMNVKYVLSPVTITLTGWEKVFETPQAATWKNPAFLPRAFLVSKILPENIETRNEWSQRSINRLERYHYMISDWWSKRKDAQIVDNILMHPVDYRTTAIVAGNDLPRLSNLDLSAKVIEAPQRGDVMRFKVRSQKPALLVISNNFYPGWTATVSGQPAKIYRTNYVGIGVFIPPGQSEVVLRFVTPGFRAGCLVTTISLVLLFFGLIYFSSDGLRSLSPNMIVRPIK